MKLAQRIWCVYSSLPKRKLKCPCVATENIVTHGEFMGHRIVWGELSCNVSCVPHSCVCVCVIPGS